MLGTKLTKRDTVNITADGLRRMEKPIMRNMQKGNLPPCGDARLSGNTESPSSATTNYMSPKTANALFVERLVSGESFQSITAMRMGELEAYSAVRAIPESVASEIERIYSKPESNTSKHTGTSFNQPSHNAASALSGRGGSIF